MLAQTRLDRRRRSAMRAKREYGESERRRGNLVGPVPFEKIDPAADDGIVGPILHRQQSERGRRHVRPKILAHHVGVAEIPSPGPARAVHKELFGFGNAVAARRVEHAHPPRLLQGDERERGGFDPTERAVDPRPGLQAVVLRLSFHLRDLDSPTRHERGQQPARRLGRGPARLRQPADGDRRVVPDVHRPARILDQPSARSLAAREELCMHAIVRGGRALNAGGDQRPGGGLEPAGLAGIVGPAAAWISRGDEGVPKRDLRRTRDGDGRHRVILSPVGGQTDMPVWSAPSREARDGPEPGTGPPATPAIRSASAHCCTRRARNSPPHSSRFRHARTSRPTSRSRSPRRSDAPGSAVPSASSPG